MYHFQKRQENVLFDQNNPVTIGRHTLTIVYKKYIFTPMSLRETQAYHYFPFSGACLWESSFLLGSKKPQIQTIDFPLTKSRNYGLYIILFLCSCIKVQCHHNCHTSPRKNTLVVFKGSYLTQIA